MASVLGRLMLLLLLILPTTFVTVGHGGPSMVFAQETDTVEGEDDEGTVEDEEEGGEEEEPSASTDTATTEQEEEEEEDDVHLKPSPDADTQILFVKPASSGDIPAGTMVRLAVGFLNKGDAEFTVESMDAAFRYPQDYSFYIHNFTAVRYNRVVEPKREATFEYGFQAHEQFQGRPFGLTVNLNYKDGEGNMFQDAVFNETINITEPDEGLDGETFFLYVVLAALAVLVLVGAQQLLASFGRKRLLKSRSPVEMGTQNNSGVDYEWLPKETLSDINKSPRRSPRTSPRQRRSKRTTGGGDE